MLLKFEQNRMVQITRIFVSTFVSVAETIV